MAARTKTKPSGPPKTTPGAGKWPATEVEMRPVSALVPYARNARTHSPQQVAQIAASIQKWGWTVPILIDENGQVIAGHGRLLAAQQLDVRQVPCMVARGWTEAEKRAYVIADNQLTLNGGWDAEMLRLEVAELAIDGTVSLDLLGFDGSVLADMLKASPDAKPEGLADADSFGELQKVATTRRGDLWLLNDHRVLCGDSTNPHDVAALCDGKLVDLIHADPPYGMGKEAAGVANDNLYDAKLDAFQMSWIVEALQRATANCGLFVWGNAPDLWRLWWQKLHEVDELTVRNELVWAKGSAFGVNSDEMHQFPPQTERCLFLMRGPQFLGNQNKDDYWPGYEPLRLWMIEQRDACKWTTADVNRITGTKMAGHWFGQSQFAVITREQYDKLRTAAQGEGFACTYDELTRKFGSSITGGSGNRATLSEQMRSSRSYFDNTHEPMTDVWEFPRVAGLERYGHATPKPVAMLARAIVSACPEGGRVLEPFLGTGSTLIAAHLFGRVCFGMELEPRYVDVVVRRWQQKTGQAATLANSNGATFDEVAASRASA